MCPKYIEYLDFFMKNMTISRTWNFSSFIVVWFWGGFFYILLLDLVNSIEDSAQN